MTRTKTKLLTWIIANCAILFGQTASAVSDSEFGKSPDGHVDVYFSHRSTEPALPDKNIGNEVLYQIVVDRFANGNPSNDCLYDGRFCAANGRDFNWYNYYGGDLRGLIQRAGYLKALGVTRLWLTPIFENQNVIVEAYKFGRWVYPTSYHGYWIRDWFRLNPMFTDSGTQDFKIVGELIEASKPIKIYLDTVANHTSPADATRESLDYLNSIEPLQDGTAYPHRGALFRDGQFIVGYDADRYRAVNQSGYRPFFHTEDRKINNFSDPWEVENLQLDRLVDFDQTNPELRKYLDDAHSFWMTKFPDLAGYRIDTIKHVPQNYWRQFSGELYRKFPNMEAFGEYWDAGSVSASSHPFYRETRFSMLDFDFRRAVLSVFGTPNRPFSDITEIWRNDPNLTDASQMITFIDSHDFPRARGIGLSQTQMRQAIALWMMSRGIPCIYYGMEQDLYFPDDPGDPFNRPMMNSFSTSSDSFELLQELISLRKRNRAARYGVTHVVHQSKNILAFERIYGAEKIFFATSKNNIAGSDEFEISSLNFPNGSYRDLLSNKVYTVRDGRVMVNMRLGDIIVFDTSSKSP
jgi:cyclomaltodextrin glucanotransferase